MSHFLLGWTGAGLLTLDLDDDRRVVMVFDAPTQAEAAATAIALASGREVEVCPVDVPLKGMRDVLDVLLGIQDQRVRVQLVLPGEDLHTALLHQLLAG